MMDREKLLTIGRLSLINIGLNAGLIAALAWPFECLWNGTIAPIGPWPQIGYLRSLGLLLIWRLLKGVADGTRIDVTFRE
jgi:hypothetical protein